MPGVKLFGPGGLFGPREVLPNPEFHAPPQPAEHAYGPPSVRNTDEWGMIIHTNEDGSLRPEYINMDEKSDAMSAISKLHDTYTRGEARFLVPPPPPPKPLTAAEEIKLLAQTLTYGEMLELVAEIWRHSPEKSLTVDSAPAVLWTWATYVYPDPPA